MKKILIFLLIVPVIVSCDNKYYATTDEYHYYFDNTDPEWETALLPLLQVDSVYTFTEESAQRGYPYYAAFKRGEKVPVNIMIKPHCTVRNLVPLGDNQEFDPGELKLQISVNFKNDTTLYSHIQAFKMEEGASWRLVVDLEDKYNINKKSKGQIAREIYMHTVRAMLK